jgi:hypothetical protein
MMAAMMVRADDTKRREKEAHKDRLLWFRAETVPADRNFWCSLLFSLKSNLKIPFLPLYYRVIPGYWYLKKKVFLRSFCKER